MKGQTYSEKIIYLETYIEKCEVSPASYGYILDAFDDIYRCDLDKVRTAKIRSIFEEKFKSILNNREILIVK